MTDIAADARRSLSRLARMLSSDCWGVLVDICLFDKGLQQIELERKWPRRAAKLVLRIALEQTAQQFGLDNTAMGKGNGRLQGWLPERVPMR